MAATTRAKTGNSKPRVIEQIEAAVAPAPKKRTTKANTSKPRSKTVASGRVEKKKAPAKSTTSKTTTTTTTTSAATGPKTKTVKKRKAPATQVKDKVEGKVEKAVGKVEGKPGKKAAGTRKEKPTTTKKIAAPKTKKAVV